MKTIDLDITHPFALGEKKFHVLGSINTDELTEAHSEKLRFRFKNKKNIEIKKPDGLWATLGWADNRHEKMKGKIEFSEVGNLSSEGASRSIIDEIYEINPLLNGHEFKVTERFINFSNVKFKWESEEFSYDQIPKLRLTLYLSKDEGALICYQHSEKNNHEDPNPEFEFIQPEKTDDRFSTERDRLNYYFPILPEEELEEEEKNGRVLFKRKKKKRKTGFILKIFTYKRAIDTADNLYREALNTINARMDRTNLAYELVGKDKYKICNYDPSSHNFVDHTLLPIDLSKKTLLLIHGTFVNVWKTFGDLFEKEFEEKRLLNQLLDDGKFEQIIAFNYPTISHDAQQNAEMFYQMMGDAQFLHPVSIVGSSRGCLLAKYFTADPKNTCFQSDKVIMFSAANGVGYFTAGKYISKFLSVMRKTSGPAGKIALSLLQFSADYFLKLPGSQLMTPKSETLSSLLRMKPNNENTEYFNVVSDWNASLAENWQKKIFGSGLDLLLKGILGKEHDWVVGCTEQEIYFNSTVNNKPPQRIVSMHARYFDIVYTKDNTHTIIYNYFH